MDRQKAYRPDKTKYPEDLRKWIIRDGYHPIHMEAIRIQKQRKDEGLPFFLEIEGLYMNSWHTVLVFEDKRKYSVIYFPGGMVPGYPEKFEVMRDVDGEFDEQYRSVDLDGMINILRELRDNHGEA